MELKRLLRYIEAKRQSAKEEINVTHVAMKACAAREPFPSVYRQTRARPAHEYLLTFLFVCLFFPSTFCVLTFVSSPHLLFQTTCFPLSPWFPNHTTRWPSWSFRT